MKKDGKNPKKIESMTPGLDKNGNENTNDPVLDLFEGDLVNRSTSRRDF